MIIRLTFWVAGLLLGTGLTYTGRFFFNTDGLTYIEMGEGLISGNPEKMVNLACSPLYAAFLGILQLIIRPAPEFEAVYLKVGGGIGLILAMAACEFFVQSLKRCELLDGNTSTGRSLTAVIYALFLTAALTWIKTRLINPDMFVFVIVIMIIGLLIRIAAFPEKFSNYAALGLFLGLGYLTKTYVLVLSPIYILAAAFLGGFRRAKNKIIVAVVLMLIVSAPLLIALSSRVGRFSFGEVASLAYTTAVSSQGDPIHKPQILWKNPLTLAFHYDRPCSDAMGFDIAYWSMGLSSGFNIPDQLRAVVRNVAELLSHSILYLLSILLALIWLRYSECISFTDMKRIRTTGIIFITSLCGVGLFAPVHLEMRYVAPSMFTGMTAVLVLPTYRENLKSCSQKIKYVLWGIIALCAILLAISAIDQSLRGLAANAQKPSYEQAYGDLTVLAGFLKSNGINPGDKVGIVGTPPILWARMARVQILVRIPDKDQFLRAPETERKQALNSAGKTGAKAVIIYGDPQLKGWERVPLTRDFYMKLL